MVVDKFIEIAPSIYLPGPVSRKYPEKNYPRGKTLCTIAGVVEDNVPEDITMVIKTDKGLVMLSGCGHGGIFKTMEYISQKFPGEKLWRPSVAFISLIRKMKSCNGQQGNQGSRCSIFSRCALHRHKCCLQTQRSDRLVKNQCVVGNVGFSVSLDKGITLGWLH